MATAGARGAWAARGVGADAPEANAGVPGASTDAPEANAGVPGVGAGTERETAQPAIRTPIAAAGASRTAVSGPRAALALAGALMRHWPGTAAHVHAQMRRWEQHAGEIADARRRAAALAKLADERFNAEAAAVIATLAPAPQRRQVAEAILALELLYDHLDGLGEQPLADPMRDGERLYATFVDAVPAGEHAHGGAAGPHTPVQVASGVGGDRDDGREAHAARSGREADRPYSVLSAGADDCYTRALAQATRAACLSLPAWDAVAPAARRCARRGVEAQTRMHAAAQLGLGPLREWAQAETASVGVGMGWRETAAGAACAVLALHALLAAAADPRTTAAQAARIEAAYLPLCAIVTLLDGIADRRGDAACGRQSYAGLYESERALGEALAALAAQARASCAALPDAPRHTMVLAAAIAYELSAPHADGPGASGRKTQRQTQALLAGLRTELAGLLAPPLTLMRGWRLARRFTGGGSHMKVNSMERRAP